MNLSFKHSHFVFNLFFKKQNQFYKINLHHHKIKQLLNVYLVSSGASQNHGGS